jgi:hypothetical protein
MWKRDKGKGMIDKFEAGRWYVYEGKARQSGWNEDGYMDYVLDGKPHLCMRSFGKSARFKDDEKNSFGMSCIWTWGESAYNFRLATTDEVEAMPDTAVKRGERVLVWDNPVKKLERTYVQTVEGGKGQYCVVLEEQAELAAFSNGKPFEWAAYPHMSRIPKRKQVELLMKHDTLENRWYLGTSSGEEVVVADMKDLVMDMNRDEASVTLRVLFERRGVDGRA